MRALWGLRGSATEGPNELTCYPAKGSTALHDAVTGDIRRTHQTEMKEMIGKHLAWEIKVA